MALEPPPQVITQRCDNAKLLIDNADEWVGIERGLIILLSMAEGATEEVISPPNRRDPKGMTRNGLIVVCSRHWQSQHALC